jgi:GT2 family glycosyltransferase
MDNLLIIIPVFEDYGMLHNALSSIDTNVDVLCIDNSVTKQAIQLKGNKLIHIKTKGHIGFGRACNIGVAKAKALGYKKAIICNQDIRFTEHSIKHLNEAIEEDPTTIWVPSVHRYNDATMEDYVIQSYGEAYQNDLSKGSLLNSYKLSFTGLPCFAINLDLLDKIGLFDPLYFMYWEDNDFIKRAQSKGIQLCLLSSAYIHHNGNEDNRGNYRDMSTFRTSRAIYYLRWLEQSFWKTQYELLRGCIKYASKLDFGNALRFIGGMIYIWKNLDHIRQRKEVSIQSRINYFTHLDQGT